MWAWETAGEPDLDPDKRIEIGLNGRSGYYTNEPEIPHAVDELRELSEGCGDLVGQPLGNILGGFIASPGTANPCHPIGADLLAHLQFDPDALTAAFEQGSGEKVSSSVSKGYPATRPPNLRSITQQCQRGRSHPTPSRQARKRPIC